MKNYEPQQKKHRGIFVTLSVLLVIGVLSGGLFLYRHQQNSKAIAKERAQYSQAEKDLDKLTAQIVAKIGQPDDQKKVKECGYTSDTFELSPKGSLYCDVEYYLYFSVLNLEHAKEQVNMLAASRIVNSKIKSLPTANDSNQVPPIKLGSQDFISSGLNCFISYGYHLASEDLKIEGYPELHLHSQDQGILVNLDCSSPRPKAAYYRIRDY